MCVERRDLVDLGEREPHLLRQRHEMRRGQMAVAVLDQMQMLDQEIAPAWTLLQQRAHFLERARIDLAPFGSSRGFPPPAARLVVDRVYRVLSLANLLRTHPPLERGGSNCRRRFGVGLS